MMADDILVTQFNSGYNDEEIIQKLLQTRAPVMFEAVKRRALWWSGSQYPAAIRSVTCGPRPYSAPWGIVYVHFAPAFLTRCSRRSRKRASPVVLWRRRFPCPGNRRGYK